MSVDVSGLKDLVRAEGKRIFDDGMKGLEAALDEAVPDSLGNDTTHSLGTRQDTGPKLRDTRTIHPNDFGDRFSAAVTYSSNKADYTEYGSEEHRIPRSGEARLAFFWPAVGQDVVFRHVQWKPGPGVARNRGWFARTMETWESLVSEVA